MTWHILWLLCQLISEAVAAVIFLGLGLGKLELRRKRKPKVTPRFVHCRHKGGAEDCPGSCAYIYGGRFWTEERKP